MSDFREDAIETIKALHYEGSNIFCEIGFASAISKCMLALHELPVNEGKWIKMSDADGVYWACSEYGEDIPRVVTQYDPRYDAYPRLESINPTSYCPHCGVKMQR